MRPMLTWWGRNSRVLMVTFAAMPALGLLAGDELPRTGSSDLGVDLDTDHRGDREERSIGSQHCRGSLDPVLLGYHAFGFFARGNDDFRVAVSWWASRGSEAVASIPLTLLASGLFLDGAVIRAWRRWTGEYVVPGAPDMTVQAVFDLVAAAIIVVAIPRRRSVRLAALLLIVPMAWTVSEVVQPMLFDLIGWGAIV